MRRPLIAVLMLAGCTVRHASPLAHRPERLCNSATPPSPVPSLRKESVAHDSRIRRAISNGDFEPGV